MTISVTAAASLAPTGTNLQRQTTILLSPETSYGELFQTVATLYQWFAQLTAIQEDPSQLEKYHDSFAASGKMISALGAARCMGDPLRTARFIQGVAAALQVAQERFPNQCLRVLYAGTGPFAALLLPLLTRWTPAQLQVTLIDIHQESLDAVACLLDHFGLGALVETLVCGDATAYRHPTDQKFHLLVSETMQKALEHEPQVAITLRLVSQLHPQGLLVPERITVQACLADTSKEFAFVDAEGGVLLERARVELGTLIDLTVETARTPAALLAPRTVHIPHDVPANLRTLLLRTQIVTFGGIVLDDYDSGLTYPTILQPAEPITPGATITFAYAMTAQPGFRIIADAAR
ncbi:MAG: hypothetical protein H0T53_12825 [Herpetosiphonaceae bacterium]|nr:hypothetical protein [Herpetosiphonaceae bacterium]